jgi:hypothetical protein
MVKISQSGVDRLIRAGRPRPAWLMLFISLFFWAVAQAHIGSPDVYFDGKAGPYQLFVTVRPPLVIPGVAELEVRSQTPGVRDIRAIPLPLSGPERSSRRFRTN